MFIIVDSQAGNKIEEFETLNEAEASLVAFEEDDKSLGIFEEDFYEIVEF